MLLLEVFVVMLLFFDNPRCKCWAKMFVGGGWTIELEDADVDTAFDDPDCSLCPDVFGTDEVAPVGWCNIDKDDVTDGDVRFNIIPVPCDDGRA